MNSPQFQIEKLPWVYYNSVHFNISWKRSLFIVDKKVCFDGIIFTQLSQVHNTGPLSKLGYSKYNKQSKGVQETFLHQ